MKLFCFHEKLSRYLELKIKSKTQKRGEDGDRNMKI